MLESLRPGMIKPEVVRCADDHFRRVVYGLGPYIADYPEQALLACIVQNWCPRYLSCIPFSTQLLTCLFRCTAPANDLDGGEYGRRSRAHTDMLVEEFELGVLWDQYGLVGDVVVSNFLVSRFKVQLRHIIHDFHLQPFTNYFPRADIHELLSPDILHQLIKGAFKDHIVTWVHDYIKAQYTEHEANKILDDIDQRYVL